MSIRKHTATVVAAITVAASAAVLLLASCGRSADDPFSNVNGRDSNPSADGSHAPDTRHTTVGDAPPNYADNSRVRQPGEMAPEGEKAAVTQAAEVKRA